MKPENSTSFDDKSLIINYLTLRKAVGILGIGLPIILAIGSVVLSSCSRIENSISDYYYTVMGHFLVGTLSAVAMFLFSYKGYDKADNRAANLAALFALGVAFFPTACADHNPFCNVLTTNSSDTINAVHNVLAVLFFSTLAYFSYFLFTKSSENITEQKLKRNTIYRICAWIMVFSIVSIALVHNIRWLQLKLEEYKPIFVLETIALWAFGVSWLVKGKFILQDK